MTPRELADLLENSIGLLGSPRQLKDAVENEILQSGTSVAVAAEETDRLLKKVASEVRMRIRECEAVGEHPVLALRNGNEIVHGSCFVFEDDTPDVVEYKHSRSTADELKSAIIQLNFSDFEKFGSRVLAEIGARNFNFTRHAGDQGIDFYGDLTVGHLLNRDPASFRLMHETKMVIVGQAKHYPERNIGPATVRELVGALSLSRTSTYSDNTVDLLDGVSLRPFTPLLALLFSTGDFTKGARSLAERAGLVVFSGTQLAVFLADKGVGSVDGKDGNKVFDFDAFQKWLNS